LSVKELDADDVEYFLLSLLLKWLALRMPRLSFQLLIRAKVEMFLPRKGGRILVLPAYTMEGYIAAAAFEGPCMAEIFEET
jgi:hypothetical protein